MITSIEETKCNGCGVCVEICPLDTLRMDPCSSKAYIAYPEDCMTCFLCEMECPCGAIYVHPFREALPLSIECEKGESHG